MDTSMCKQLHRCGWLRYLKYKKAPVPKTGSRASSKGSQDTSIKVMRLIVNGEQTIAYKFVFTFLTSS